MLLWDLEKELTVLICKSLKNILYRMALFDLVFLLLRAIKWHLTYRNPNRVFKVREIFKVLPLLSLMSFFGWMKIQTQVSQALVCHSIYYIPHWLIDTVGIIHRVVYVELEEIWRRIAQKGILHNYFWIINITSMLYYNSMLVCMTVIMHTDSFLGS